MELTFHTDYALRTLIYLGLRRGRLCQIAEIAEHYAISRNHLVKVVHHMARGGFVATFRGKGGGVSLARDPGAITVGAVVRYTEGPMRLVECFRAETNECVITQGCSLAGILREAGDNFLATLDRYTLADLLANRRRLARLLALPDAARGASHS
jgi:Rrf2 family nitric oxide-sensitive transcriptional repressor